MPNKSKSKNNSRNSSRKSTASSQGSLVVKKEDDDFASIVMVNRPSPIKKKTPKNTSPSTPSQTPRPEFLEPLSPKPAPPPPSPWEILGMPETEYVAMTKRVQAMYREMERESYREALIAELDDPRFWQSRIEQLEREREFFNKKRGWSAADLVCVERIDAQIEECEDELERIYAEEDRLEAEYD